MKVRYIAKFGAYYTRKLISLSIFLVVKWGQSSLWRSCDRTCALSAVIYGWESKEIKLQLPQTTWRYRYVYGKTTATAVLKPSWFSWLSEARLVNCYRTGTPPTHNMAAKSDTERNVACLVDNCHGNRARVLCLLPLAPFARILALLGTTGADDSVYVISHGRGGRRRCVARAFGAGA